MATVAHSLYTTMFSFSTTKHWETTQILPDVICPSCNIQVFALEEVEAQTVFAGTVKIHKTGLTSYQFLQFLIVG